jgi:hypothetical protein
MALQLRHPLIEDQFCTFNPDSVETLTVPAGKLVRVVGTTSDGRTIVDVVSDISAQTVFGWLMQAVKAAPTDFPSGYMYRGDLGSTNAFLGDPVGVAHGPGAVYETNQYVDEASDGIVAGALLYCDDDGKLSDTNADSSSVAHAQAMHALTSSETAAGKVLRVKALI